MPAPREPTPPPPPQVVKKPLRTLYFDFLGH
jgi:hypothetical protein